MFLHPLKFFNALILVLGLSFCLSQNHAQAQLGLVRKIVFNQPKDNNVIDSLGYAHAKQLSAKSIKVLVWNAHKGEDDSWGSDLRALGKNSDIIMIQEAVFNVGMLTTFLTLPGRLWTNATSFRMLHQGNIGTGLSTASVAAPTHQSYLRTIITEPVVGTTKLTLFTKYKIQGQQNELLAVNVHAINFVTPWEFYIEMNRLKRAMEKHTGPIILAGDFNTWTDGRTQKLEKIARELSLNAVPFPDGARQSSLGLILDHAYVRGLVVKKVDNLGHISSSDHAPMAFELALP